MGKQIIICENCGSENSAEEKLCSACGASLNSNLVSEIDESVETNSEEKSTQKKKYRFQNQNDPEKVLNTTKIVYLTVVLFVVGGMILTFSGMFDRPVATPTENSEQNPNDPHSGVDMGAFQDIKKLEEIVQNNPQNFNALLELAHLLNDSQLNDRAIVYYKKYLEKFPDVADVIVDLGVCYYELGQNETAISTMESALKYEPKHQIAHLNLGIVNMASNNHDVALEWFRKAEEINPNSNVGRRAKELLNQH